MTVGDLYTDIDYRASICAKARGNVLFRQVFSRAYSTHFSLIFVGLSVTLVSALPFIDRTRTTYDIVTLV